MDGVTLDAILSMVIKMADIKKNADYIVEKINEKMVENRIQNYLLTFDENV